MMPSQNYGYLSLRAGFIAGTCDVLLDGGNAFGKCFRNHRWTLTPELVVTLMVAAMTLGVQLEELNQADSYIRLVIKQWR